VTAPRPRRVFVYRDRRLLEALVEVVHNALRRWPIGHASIWEDALRNPAWRDVSPDRADYFLVPVTFSCADTVVWRGRFPTLTHERGRRHFLAFDAAIRAALQMLPHFRRHSRRHLCLQLGDLNEDFPAFEGLVLFKHAACRSSKALALPYWVRPELWRAAVRAGPIERCSLDLCFRGDAALVPLRRRLEAAIDSARKAGLRCSFMHRPNGAPDGREVAAYARELATTRFVLCPRGVASNSIRFFESLLFGRIPVLVSDDAKLPLEGLIRFEDFVVRVPEKDITRAHQYILEFLRGRSISEASRLAQAAFLDYLSSETAFVQRSLDSRRFVRP